MTTSPIFRFGTRRLAALVIMLVSAACPAKAADALGADQKAAIEAVVRDYIAAHPEIIVDALRTAKSKTEADEAAQAKTALRTHRAELEASVDSPIAGNPQGDVTIVEFFDFRCPYCKSMTPTLVDLLAKDAGVKVVYKDLPILGAESLVASRIALVAATSGKYQAFHDAAMASKTPLTAERSFEIARSIGLDPAKVKLDMQAPRIDRILKDNMALAVALGIEGTPAFVIGDTLTPGAVDLDTLRGMIAAARKAPPSKG
ncbi:MAG TPA: DsbA family protein [Stellaceae bacterium]|nr:DsbA family protein [Stellaceae bacterium]